MTHRSRPRCRCFVCHSSDDISVPPHGRETEVVSTVDNTGVVRCPGYPMLFGGDVTYSGILHSFGTVTPPLTSPFHREIHPCGGRPSHRRLRRKCSEKSPGAQQKSSNSCVWGVFLVAAAHRCAVLPPAPASSSLPLLSWLSAATALLLLRDAVDVDELHCRSIQERRDAAGPRVVLGTTRALGHDGMHLTEFFLDPGPPLPKSSLTCVEECAWWWSGLIALVLSLATQSGRLAGCGESWRSFGVSR